MSKAKKSKRSPVRVMRKQARRKPIPPEPAPRKGTPLDWNPSRLRVLRAVESLTLTALAGEIGISRSVLCEMERPGGRGPSPSEVRLLAAHFGVPESYFLGPTLRAGDMAKIDEALAES